MRSEEEIISLLIHVASSDDRIRAVLLNGSRADPKATKDRLRDFDIIYIVRELNTFLKDHSWIDIFGERLILQMPDQMTFGDRDDISFHYLMLFKDENRIDLTIFPVDKLKSEFKKNSLTVLLLDKDHLFENLPPSDDQDYLIKRPAQKEFTDCCNEFWWVSAYVAKGLWRNEITYAKYMLEIFVRPMFLRIIEWHIGIKKDFKVSFGTGGKYMKDHISPDLYSKIISTYPDGNSDNIWNSLFLMTGVFSDLANQVAQAMGLRYDVEEDHNVTEYLKKIYKE